MVNGVSCEDSCTVTYDDGEEDFTPCASAAPPESDGYGTFTQTDFDPAMQSTLTLEEEKLLKDELNGLLLENVKLQEEISAKEIKMESLQGQDDTVKYFTGLQSYMVLAALFSFSRTFAKCKAASSFSISGLYAGIYSSSFTHSTPAFSIYIWCFTVYRFKGFS